MSRASAQDTPSALLRACCEPSGSLVVAPSTWAQSAGRTAISRRSLEARRRCGAWSSTGFDTVEDAKDAVGKTPYQGPRGNQWASGVSGAALWSCQARGEAERGGLSHVR